MKTIAVTLALTAFATSAVAQPRASTLNMSCGQARAVVATQGAVVLGTGGYTYDRFVNSGNFCQVTEYIEPAWVPTADTPQCPIGYLCREGPRDLFDR
jgi:hypothetical protein